MDLLLLVQAPFLPKINGTRSSGIRVMETRSKKMSLIGYLDIQYRILDAELSTIHTSRWRSTPRDPR